MDKYWSLWGIKLFWGNIAEVVEIIEKRLEKRKKTWIATVNTEFMMAAREDKNFMEILKKTDLNVVDGNGLVLGRRLLDKKFFGKVGSVVAGSDLINELCKLAEKKGKTVYFFGGWNDRSERTAKHFLKKYPKLKIAGYRAEDFDFETRADMLFVARGMKAQEEWIEKNLEKLKVGVVMGVGRSFDYYSGDLKRASKIWRKLGLEWLYSLIQEPKRWKRQLRLAKFIKEVLIEKYMGR